MASRQLSPVSHCAPDPAALVARIRDSARLNPRTKDALLLYAAGLSVRECARAVGLKDHMSIHRAAMRYGLRELHNEARARVEKTANSQSHRPDTWPSRAHEGLAAELG